MPKPFLNYFDEELMARARPNRATDEDPTKPAQRLNWPLAGGEESQANADNERARARREAGFGYDIILKNETDQGKAAKAIRIKQALLARMKKQAQ